VEGKTVVEVVHKLEGVVRERAFDRVVVLERGGVVEVGEVGEGGGISRGLWESRG
jgi:ABC-type uncharacterized transport system ATPase subunit